MKAEIDVVILFASLVMHLNIINEFITIEVKEEKEIVSQPRMVSIKEKIADCCRGCRESDGECPFLQ